MRLIDADALKAHYAWWDCSESGAERKRIFDTIVDLQPTAGKHFLEVQPLADVAPVRHGRWIIGKRTNVYGGREIICSECGEGFMVSPKTLEFLSDTERYCCRCGAKMDGDDGETERD